MKKSGVPYWAIRKDEGESRARRTSRQCELATQDGRTRIYGVLVERLPECDAGTVNERINVIPRTRSGREVRARDATGPR